MAKFFDNYPEYRKKHGNVSKHVTLVTNIGRIVEERKFMIVSQIEQELACSGGQVAAFVFTSDQIIILAMIYFLIYFSQ